MEGIIVVCMLHFNTAWLGVSIRREDWIVDSQVQCNKLALEKGWNFAGTGSVMAYDMTRESDRKQFKVRCGENGKDCRMH